MTEWTPKPPPPKPPIARQHCRHYGYTMGLKGGPTCGAGVDNTSPGGALPCMPDAKVSCEARQDWTAAERAAWEAWSREHRERAVAVLIAIPDDRQGRMDCPGCGTGKVSWARASNGHLHAGCTTPNCFTIIQ